MAKRNGQHLKRIELQNFGPFQFAVLDDLDKEVKFAGPNDAGKTMIMTAVVSALLGQGFDSSFIYRDPHATKQVKEAAVILDWYDGRSMEMRLSGATMKWKLIADSADTTCEPILLTGKRDKGITEQIQQFTGYSEVAVDSSQKVCLNVFELGSPNFLMDGRNPMAVMAMINKYAGSGKLEEVLKRLTSQTGKITQGITAQQALVKDYTAKKKALQITKVKKEEVVVKRAVATMKRIDLLQQSIEPLKTMGADIAETQGEISDLTARERVLIKGLKKAKSLLSAIDAAQETYESAAFATEEIDKLAARVAESKAELSACGEKISKISDQMAEWLAKYVPAPKSFELCSQCGCVTCKEKK